MLKELPIIWQTCKRQLANLNSNIEGSVDAGGKAGQIDILGNLTKVLEKRSSPVKLVAYEWCNNYQDIVDFTDAKCCHMVQIKTPDLGSIHNIVETVLYRKQNNMEAYRGGTCNETDVSARTCVQIAMACRSAPISKTRYGL